MEEIIELYRKIISKLIELQIIQFSAYDVRCVTPEEVDAYLLQVEVAFPTVEKVAEERRFLKRSLLKTWKKHLYMIFAVIDNFFLASTLLTLTLQHAMRCNQLWAIALQNAIHVQCASFWLAYFAEQIGKDKWEGNDASGRHIKNMAKWCSACTCYLNISINLMHEDMHIGRFDPKKAEEILVLLSQKLNIRLAITSERYFTLCSMDWIENVLKSCRQNGIKLIETIIENRLREDCFDDFENTYAITIDSIPPNLLVTTDSPGKLHNTAISTESSEKEVVEATAATPFAVSKQSLHTLAQQTRGHVDEVARTLFSTITAVRQAYNEREKTQLHNAGQTFDPTVDLYDNAEKKIRLRNAKQVFDLYCDAERAIDTCFSAGSKLSTVLEETFLVECHRQLKKLTSDVVAFSCSL